MTDQPEPDAVAATDNVSRDTEPPALTAFQEADRFILGIEYGFDFELVNEWPAVGGALAARVLELRAKPPVDVDEVRRVERHRLAALFEQQADALRTMAPDGLTPELVAFMLKLDHG